MVFDVAVIGTGPNPEDPGPDGYAMGYRHARAYREVEGCRLAACADIVPENAESFATEFGIDHVFYEYETMHAEVEPDLVSVCVPPDVHADIVIGCAESGVPRAVHCEKPMATTWRDCRQMVAVAEREDVQLTFNHQRRFGVPFRKAKAILDEGTVGDLRRIEFSTSTLLDMGSHYFDLANFYADQAPVEWVMGQVDYRDENILFGTHNENQALVQWKYTGDVYGLASTGWGDGFTDATMRLVGADGVVEIGVDDGPSLRVQTVGRDWQTVATDGETIHGAGGGGLVDGLINKTASIVPGLDRTNGTGPHDLHVRAIKSVVEALQTGSQSELDKEFALDATELIFAAWESARRAGRVDLPLEIDDNPLEAMIEDGRVLATEKSG